MYVECQRRWRATSVISGDGVLSFLCCSSSGSWKLQLQPVSSLHSGKNTMTIHMNLASRKAGKAAAAWAPSRITTASG